MTLNNLKPKDSQQKLMKAFKDGSEEAFATAMVQFADSIQESVIEEARQSASDSAILAARGKMVLTASETKYYQDVIDNEGFDGVEGLVPATVFERVFDDLQHSHGLLEKIAFVNTTDVSEFITSRGVNTAWWGKLTATIKEILDNGFDTVNVKQMKLSGYIPVSKAMLDLGPQWLDKYVRTVLVEAMKIGLETAIVDGDGKDQPIGMTRDVTNVTDGAHPLKTAIDLADYTPKALGQLMSKFGKLTLEGVEKPIYRDITPEEVVFLVNPVTYWAQVYPAITIQLQTDGSYRTGLALPFAMITSVAVPEGQAVIGVGRDYFMGIGSELKIATSDEVKFIDDQRVYLAKQYGNGAPKNNDSFLLVNLPKA